MIHAGAGDNWYRFDHTLVREALLERTGLPNRRRWYRRVAEALLDRRADDVEAIAHHFGQAGDPRAVPFFIEAGDRSLRLRAYAPAAERYRCALELALPEDERRSPGSALGPLRRQKGCKPFGLQPFLYYAF